MQIVKGAAIAAAFFSLVACRGGSVATPAAQARIVLNTESSRPTIDVVDIPADQLGRIYGTDSRDAWTAILKISAGADQAPAVGQYAIAGERIRFTPMFPLDHGRQYHVTFTPPGGAPITATVGLPPVDRTPTTSVAQMYPTTELIPENQLRLYLEFSAPMERRGGLDVVHLTDQGGREVNDPFLPLDADGWNEERTRYTIAFDPDRPSITAGQSYTLVIDAKWFDGHGLPLKQSFRRTFKVGPPELKPIDPKLWKFETPAAGSTDPLTVTFAGPLDHDRLSAALRVLAPNGRPLEGEMIVGPEESSWAFTPDQPWKAGAHHLVALAELEDRAGNRIAAADQTLVPFSVR
jgi:hypothetical protein